MAQLNRFNPNLRFNPLDLLVQQEEAKKKMLDKALKKVYNTLRGTGGSDPQVYTFSEPPVEFSADETRSLLVFSQIEEALDNATEACIKEGYPFPIVSGGSIRDGMLGRRYKDIDIFVDVSNMGDEELDAQDRFLLLADRLFPAEKAWTFRKKNGDDYEKRESYFELYEGVNDRTNQTIQIVGHNAPTISSENPLDFTADYPYNIIRNYASAEDGIVISGAAMEGFKTKTLVCLPDGANKMYDFYYGSGLQGWKTDDAHEKKAVKLKNRNWNGEVLKQYMEDNYQRQMNGILDEMLAPAHNLNPGVRDVFPPIPDPQPMRWGDLMPVLHGARREAQMNLNALDGLFREAQPVDEDPF